MNTQTQSDSARAFARARQGFVKFFGASDNRLPHSHSVLEEVKRAGCHWACTYPVSKRPRSVQDGAVIYMGRLVTGPEDIRVFGRAIAIEHRPGRDDATPEEIEDRPWKARWPCYLRVRNPQFIDGRLGDGVSVLALMDELGSDTWESSRRRAAETGQKSIDPRASLAQQTQLELTLRAIERMNALFESCLANHGAIDQPALAKLDWPDLPNIKRAL